jgi:hypothetical protein
MKNPKPCSNCKGSRRPKEEAGVALVIAIIGLLLLTAVAAGMVLMSNGEVNVDSNYRDQQVALFAAKAGLQEARDRMLSGNASPITLPTVLPGGAGAYATYLVASGVTPWTSGSTISTANGSVSTYDQEFVNEMTSAGLSAPSGSTWHTSSTISSTYSGPTTNPVPYKWVRINLKLNESLDSSTGTAYMVNSSISGKDQVCYDTVNQHEVVITAASCQAASSNYQNVYEVTSYAVTPNGTTRMVQDDVAPLAFNLNFPSALTMAGTVGNFNGATSNPYDVDGVDGSGSAPAVAGCSTNSNNKVDAIGATSSGSVTTIDAGIPSNRQTHYTGSCGSTPCVGTVSLNTSDSTPAQLNQTLQTIEQSAAVSLVPTNPPVGGANYTFSQVSSAMPGGSWSNPSTNPQVIYVDGNFDLGPNTGSGLLVVTGNFSYQGNSGWNGIIMVVGNGTTTFSGSGGGNGEFDGALFVATTKDANGNQLSSFGQTNFNISGGGGNGIYYNSCWVNYVQQPQTYKLLSSKEISH